MPPKDKNLEDLRARESLYKYGYPGAQDLSTSQKGLLNVDAINREKLGQQLSEVDKARIASMPEPMASQDTTMFPSLSGYFSSSEKETPYSGIMDKISYAQAKGNLPSLSGMASNIKTGFQSLIGQQPQATPQTTQTAPEGSSFLKDAGKALAYGLLGAGMGYGGASPSQIYGTFQAGKEAYELDNPESSTSQQYTNLVKNYSRLLGIPEETYLKTGAQLTARSLAPAVKELSDMYGMKEKERMMRIGQGNVMNRADYNFARTQAFKTAKDIAESKQTFNSMNTYMDTMINILTKPQAGTGQPRTPSSFRRGEIGEYVGGLGELGKSLRTAFPGTFSDVDVTAFNNAKNQLAYSVARMFDKGALSNQDINIKLKNLTDASDPNAREKLAEIKAMINEDLARNLGEKYDQFNYLRDLTGIEVPIPEATSTVGKAKVESGLFGKK